MGYTCVHCGKWEEPAIGAAIPCCTCGSMCRECADKLFKKLSKKLCKRKTMDEQYGDGSDHVCCPGCGCCLTCGDCICKEIEKGQWR